MFHCSTQNSYRLSGAYLTCMIIIILIPKLLRFEHIHVDSVYADLCICVEGTEMGEREVGRA